MATFTDESGAETRNGRSSGGDTPRTHLRTTACSEGAFPHPQFSGWRVPNPLTHRLIQQDSLVSGCNVLSAGTATDDSVSKGGDGSMHQY